MTQQKLSLAQVNNCRNLLLDFNGTLALDGVLIIGVRELLLELTSRFSVHIITADTFGLAREELKGVECEIYILKAGDEIQQKLKYLVSLDAEETVCIGNGNNDELMIKHAALGIVVIGPEGASGNCFSQADIICTSIIDALNLLIHPKRILATLRK